MKPTLVVALLTTIHRGHPPPQLKIQPLLLLEQPAQHRMILFPTLFLLSALMVLPEKTGDFGVLGTIPPRIDVEK